MRCGTFRLYGDQPFLSFVEYGAIALDWMIRFPFSRNTYSTSR